jgi:hypothetical protein
MWYVCGAATVQGRFESDMATSPPPDDGFINPLRAFPNPGLDTGTRSAFSRADDHAWGPIRRIPITGPNNSLTPTTPSPPRPPFNPLLSSRQSSGLSRQDAYNRHQYEDSAPRLDDPYRDMLTSGLL